MVVLLAQERRLAAWLYTDHGACTRLLWQTENMTKHQNGETKPGTAETLFN